jgi:hypothetical protein
MHVQNSDRPQSLIIRRDSLLAAALQDDELAIAPFGFDQTAAQGAQAGRQTSGGYVEVVTPRRCPRRGPRRAGTADVRERAACSWRPPAGVLRHCRSRPSQLATGGCAPRVRGGMGRYRPGLPPRRTGNPDRQRADIRADLGGFASGPQGTFAPLGCPASPGFDAMNGRSACINMHRCCVRGMSASACEPGEPALSRLRGSALCRISQAASAETH